MSKHKSKEEWTSILESAARSELSVSDFCKQNGIPLNLFYRNSLRFGYTCGGKRTEKWAAAASAAQKRSDPQNQPALVPVPVQTIQAALEPGRLQDDHSQVSILYDSFRITVGDNFSQDTLRRVLEVVRYA